jgi:phosphoglycolate phosphatase
MKAFDLIFDFDGTLIDSAPSILTCLGEVVDAAGLELKRPLNRSLIGPPLQETLARITGLTAPEMLLPLIESFKELYDTSGLHATHCYPGIQDVLKQLHEHGASLHLATNKRMTPTRSIIELLGWGAYFTSIYTLDMRPDHHADKTSMLKSQLQEQCIDPSRAIYIGDTRADGLAAEGNGMRFIAADWGYGDFHGWSGTRAWSHVMHPPALLDEIRTLSCA